MAQQRSPPFVELRHDLVEHYHEIVEHPTLAVAKYPRAPRAVWHAAG